MRTRLQATIGGMRIGLAGVLNLAALFVCALLFLFVYPQLSSARNIAMYSDTLSDSRPQLGSNHTMRFTVAKAIAPGGTINITFPPNFEVATDTTYFDTRNVSLAVNGTVRDSGPTPTLTSDGVQITRGLGGGVLYTLNSIEGIPANAELELKIGNHTLDSVGAYTIPATTTGSTTVATTTYLGDIEPVRNPYEIGTHRIDFEVSGASEPMYAQFVIAVVPGVSVGPGDTRESIPPFRFDPAPTSTVGGTTLFVEISLRTDEFAFCRYASLPNVDFNAMTNVFQNTGLVRHSTVVPVVRGALNSYFIRCIDDEGNFNIDDFIIAFAVNDAPTGTSNEEGDVEGNGTGSGNNGSGDGSGSGGTTGDSDGEADTVGGNSGGGGSGGGGGGRTGPETDDQTGGGFEVEDGPYPSGDAEVIITGYAFPGSTVYAIVDGKAGGNVRASSDGRYSITISRIARGAYTFGVYAIDRNQVRSSVFSTSFTVTGGRTSSLSNINVMPTVRVAPNPVTPGQALTISGYTIPNATVTLENQRDGSAASRREFTATANSSGEWSVSIETGNFGQGTYKARAKATAPGVTTNYSNYTFYGVGQSSNAELNADLNTDGRVNLTDFSILLFWWGRDGGNSNPPADINRDGTVSLTDFSIMLFQWTG